jgi:hypothetical protein
MPVPFNLTSGGTTYSLDDKGNVTTGGTWTVDGQNDVVITPAGGGAAVTIAVKWGFNGSNQLTLTDAAGTAQWSLSTASGKSPALALDKTQRLTVAPDSNQAFTFVLIGLWTIVDNASLTYSVNGNASTLTQGYLDDPSGQFHYHFWDLADPNAQYDLVFSGSWKTQAPDQVNPKEPTAVEFDFTQADNSAGKFPLPSSLDFDPNSNLFFYKSDAAGNNTIQLVGVMTISDKYVMTYAISDQFNSDGSKSVGGTSLSFKLQPLDSKANGAGQTDYFSLTLTDSPTSQKITIGGAFSASYPSGVLTISFSFSQTSAAGVVSNSLNIAGSFSTARGANTLDWSISLAAGGAVAISLDDQFTLGNARGDLSLNVTYGPAGQAQGVSILLGFHFP